MTSVDTSSQAPSSQPAMTARGLAQQKQKAEAKVEQVPSQPKQVTNTTPTDRSVDIRT